MFAYFHVEPYFIVTNFFEYVDIDTSTYAKAPGSTYGAEGKWWYWLVRLFLGASSVSLSLLFSVLV